MIAIVGILALISLWLWALFDCATTPADRVRYLPKLGWLAVIVVLSWIGILGWFWFGRPGRGARAEAWQSLQTTPPSSRPGTSARRDRGPIGPDDDPDFLSRL